MSKLNIKRDLLFAEALQFRHAARVADYRTGGGFALYCGGRFRCAGPNIEALKHQAHVIYEELITEIFE